MIDVEPVIVRELNALVPAPGSARADWRDVERRAGTRAASRRRAAVALALAAAAVVVAVAVARSFGDFSAWLTGRPGKPVSTAEQRAFERATRSWIGFPRGTRLRRLLETRAGGSTFTLYGFRAMGSFCLRLSVRGPSAGKQLSCVPLSELRDRNAPVLVVTVDAGFGIDNRPVSAGPVTFLPPRDAVTMGIVADGVARIEVAPTAGARRGALVGGNSFLYVLHRPRAARVARVLAIARDGSRTRVPLVPNQILQQTAPPFPRARGPATLERVVHGGAIRWLARREPRGAPVPRTLHHMVETLPTVIFRRLVTPDPRAPERMVVAVLPAPNADRHFANKLMVCADLVGGRYRGGGCWHAGRLFSTAPFAWGAGRSGSDQYVTIAGVASDDVTQMALYLATGERVAIPLHDNAYFVRAALAKYPLRLVAYDARDRVIGVKTVKGDRQATLRAQPVQGARWRTVIHNGAGDLTTAPSTDGGTCFAIRTPRAGGELSCRPRVWQGPPLQVGVGGAAGSAYVGGAVRADVARVVVRFEDGGSMTVVPVDGYVLSGVPRLHLRPGYAHGVAELEARDAARRVVATRRLR